MGCSFQKSLDKIFSYLKAMDSSRNFEAFFTSIIKKVDLYANTAKKKY